MRTFLVKNKKPIIKWSQIEDGRLFVGKVPEGYDLAINPSKGFIIVDVDNHNGVDGFKAIPSGIQKELFKSLNYPTKNAGRHFWLRYTGKKDLQNTTSRMGFDLRTHKGYVVFYPRDYKVWEYLSKVKPSSQAMNEWLDGIF